MGESKLKIYENLQKITSLKLHYLKKKKIFFTQIWYEPKWKKENT